MQIIDPQSKQYKEKLFLFLEIVIICIVYIYETYVYYNSIQCINKHEKQNKIYYRRENKLFVFSDWLANTEIQCQFD